MKRTRSAAISGVVRRSLQLNPNAEKTALRVAAVVGPLHQHHEQPLPIRDRRLTNSGGKWHFRWNRQPHLGASAAAASHMRIAENACGYQVTGAVTSDGCSAPSIRLQSSSGCASRRNSLPYRLRRAAPSTRSSVNQDRSGRRRQRIQRQRKQRPLMQQSHQRNRAAEVRSSGRTDPLFLPDSPANINQRNQHAVASSEIEDQRFIRPVASTAGAYFPARQLRRASGYCRISTRCQHAVSEVEQPMIRGIPCWTPPERRPRKQPELLIHRDHDHDDRRRQWIDADRLSGSSLVRGLAVGLRLIDQAGLQQNTVCCQSAACSGPAPASSGQRAQAPEIEAGLGQREVRPATAPV